jgi:hypothetical protein
MTNQHLEPIIPGFFIDLEQLRYLLIKISRGDRIWSCPRTVSEDSDWIAIHYSNPIYGEALPNQIIYRFPLFHDEASPFSAHEKTYICLSPHVAEEVQGGLYIEDDGVKEDSFEDLSVLLDPIRFELLRQLRLWDGQTAALEDRDGDVR